MDLDARITLLRGTAGFADVEAEVLKALVATAKPRILAAGERLFTSGEEYQREVYVLVAGEIELQRADGRLEYPPPGHLLGLSSYLTETPYASTATARSEVELLVVSAASLHRLERQHAALFDTFNRLIVLGLRERRLATAPASGSLSQAVRTVASAPLACCPATCSLRDAVEQMDRDDVGSLVVTGADGRLAGVATYRSLARRLVAQGGDPGATPITEACRAAATIEADAALWQAQDRLERDRIKHLVVVEPDGKPSGIVSQTDIVRLLAARESTTLAAVAEASSHEELARHYQDIAKVAARALETNRQARVAVRALSDVHLAIQRRCIDLTLASTKAETGSGPPVPFALIIMGSGGRCEMMLDPDQDNGLIISDQLEDAGATARPWFAAFCEQLNSNLDRVGYRLCPGDIMARNPVFHRTLGEWKRQFSRLVQRPSDKAARWSNIVFDFQTQYGDDSLTRSLREHLHEELRAKPLLLEFMVEDDAQGQAPLSLFNRLVATGERRGKEIVDVQRNGLRIVSNAARILALRARVSSANTSERITALMRHGVISSDFAATVLAAYDALLYILLAHQVDQRLRGEALDKEVAPEDLTPPARESLRVAMRAVKRFQERLQDEIGRPGGF